MSHRIDPADELDPKLAQTDEFKQNGVLTAEAGRAVAGWTLWSGILGIGLVAYLYGLDNNTMWGWLSYATTSWGDYPKYTAIYIIQQVLIAVAKFPIAKLADVFGRAQAYSVAVFFWILGFIIIAASPNTGSIIAGTVLYAIGNSGVQIMQQIVIADYISTKWRGAAIGLVSTPYIVNFAVAPRIVSALADLSKTGEPWRWGPGFFCICAPVAVAPIILALAINQRTAKAKGLVPAHPYKSMSIWSAIGHFFSDIDFIGLFLICVGFLLLLLPLNLAKLQTDGWQTGWIIAMLVLGGVLLIAFAVWEVFFSPFPLLNRRWRLNKDVHIATWIGFFDFFSFYASWTPAYTWVMIVKDWDNTDAGYFSNTQSLCLTVFGIAAGFISLASKQYKWTLITGSVIRMLGIGLMIRYRETVSSTFQVVMPQVLQGLGGGFLGVTLQVAAQVSVRHQDVATVTAYVLLITEIGGACGSALVGAVQTNVLPGLLDKHLPMLDAATRQAIYGAPTFYLTTYPLGTPERTGIIDAYNEYMHKLLIIGIVLAAPPILLGFLVSNYKLNNKQNCVSDEMAGMGRGSADSSSDGASYSGDEEQK